MKIDEVSSHKGCKCTKSSKTTQIPKTISLISKEVAQEITAYSTLQLNLQLKKKNSFLKLSRQLAVQFTLLVMNKELNERAARYQMALAEATARIERIETLYAAGIKIFPREVLADIDRQLQIGEKIIRIPDMEGNIKEYKNLVSEEDQKNRISPCIGYTSFEALTDRTRAFIIPTSLTAPLSIRYSWGYNKPETTFEKMCQLYDQHQLEWSRSQTCKYLTECLRSVALPRIDRIVGFGLGAFCDWPQAGAAPSYWQHFALKTIASVIESAMGVKVSCFVQDPAYDDLDLLMLEKMEIQSLTDPKGFLAVTESTLVVSINPNVPVRQVVADDQWPAAMLWNTMKPESKEKFGCRQERLPNGEMSDISSYSTDPSSARVRFMISHYDPYNFVDFDDNFGDLTFYVRKSST